MKCKRNRAHQEVHWQSETYEQPTIGVRRTNSYCAVLTAVQAIVRKAACLRKSSGLDIGRREIQTQMLLLTPRV